MVPYVGDNMPTIIMTSDTGGGTLDVTITIRMGHDFTVLHIDGLNHHGGLDINHILVRNKFIFQFY